MPTIYRSMRIADDGFPAVAPSANGLGVREPPDPNVDVTVVEGFVQCDGRGMSCASAWRHLPAHRIPVHLRTDRRGAGSPTTVRCWRFGEGVFEAGAINDRLRLTLKSGSDVKGNVVPASPVSVADYQADLAATRSGWSIDET